MRQEYPEENLLSFGGRHIHPAMGNVLERNAHIAGFDGFSLMSAEDMLGQEANGTMPHALILSYGEGNQEEAWTAFNENVPEDVPRIALVDTFADEVVETERAVKALGDDLDGVRIDTTSSRRGDFEQILSEVRWKLESLGREDVDVFVSGGMDIEGISEVQDLIDGVGVGSYISDGRPLDFGLDIIQIDGTELSKRGKFSSVKSVYRTPEGDHVIKREDDIVPDDYTYLFETAIDDGERLIEYDVSSSREHCQEELQNISGRVAKK
jgi:nicotinate phosphoribosyltransferase